MDARRSEAPPIELGALGRDLMEALPGGAAYIESDGSIVWANAECLRLLGLSFEELTQRYVAEFGPATFNEDGSPCAIENYPVTRALVTGEPQAARTMGVRRADGSMLWAVFSALPVKDANNSEVKGAIVTFLDITERKRVEEELSRSRDLLRTAQKIANVGSWELDLASGIVHWTEQMYEIHGIPEHTFQDRQVRDALRFVHPDDAPAVSNYTDKVLKEGVPVPSEYRIVRPDGALRTIWSDGQVVCDDSGRPYKVIGAIQDVTERRALEDQLRQSQRMESIGRLAGGIAHDFNNLLQVILGNADIAVRDPTKQTALIEIKMAAQRAAELTRQLLAFGRRQPFAPTDLDLGELTAELTPLLRRMLGERVGVEFQRAAELAAVSADRGQIEQVLINLCINARDAMPEGGQIVIRMHTVICDERFRLRRPWANAARYVALSVTDGGSGMEPEVRARALEPFFTTKDAGAGTGLGLAVVYGIVQQHRGEIEIESTPGGGTSVHVYLPALEHPIKTFVRVPEVIAPGGSETLLVVEDEVMVQKLVVNVLKSAGYRVLAARDGKEALALFERQMDRISLVLVDMIMPGMSGRELEQRMHALRPKLAVLYTTGYASDPNEIAELGGERVLYKPYDRNVLLREIRTMLDAKK
jgi:PAS domain S-box-containing protein